MRTTNTLNNNEANNEITEGALTPNNDDEMALSNIAFGLAKTVGQHVRDLIVIITYIIPRDKVNERNEVIDLLFQLYEKIDNPSEYSQYELDDIIDQLNCFLENIRINLKKEITSNKDISFTNELQTALERVTENLYLSAKKITSYYNLNVGISPNHINKEDEKSFENEQTEIQASDDEEEKEDENIEYCVDSDTLYLLLDKIQHTETKHQLVYNQIQIKEQEEYRNFIQMLDAINENDSENEQLYKNILSSIRTNESSTKPNKEELSLTTRMHEYIHYIQILISYSFYINDYIDPFKSQKEQLKRELNDYLASLSNTNNLFNTQLMKIHRCMRIFINDKLIPQLLANIENSHENKSRHQFKTHAALITLTEALLLCVKKLTPLKNAEIGMTPDYSDLNEGIDSNSDNILHFNWDISLHTLKTASVLLKEMPEDYEERELYLNEMESRLTTAIQYAVGLELKMKKIEEEKSNGKEKERLDSTLITPKSSLVSFRRHSLWVKPANFKKEGNTNKASKQIRYN